MPTNTSETDIKLELTGYIPNRFEEEALNAINREKNSWDDSAVFITGKVSYMMRNVIERARKYYAGVFDDPTDSVTGEDKTWIPLTEWTTEAVVKSIDLDTKDILILPGNPQSVGVTKVIRAMIRNFLKEINFGELLNVVLRNLSIDGTSVVKTFETVDSLSGEKIISSKPIELLNFWIDPSADSIQESSAVIERESMSEAEIEDMENVWKNTKFVSFSSQVPNIKDTGGSDKGVMLYAEVWERWGKIRKSWITRDIKDKNEWIEGHIVASGAGSPSVIHLIRENPRKDNIRPYEEARYKRINGRWYGRGIPEMIFGIQEYINTVVNIRKNNNLVLQNGIFLIRKGSGLTPDMISSITAGGGLPVTDIQRDVKQLSVQDFRQSSYLDEERAYTWSDRVTGAFDVRRGEPTAPSTSATASLIQERSSRDTFTLVQEGIGFFIEKLILRHYIPLLKNKFKSEDYIRISGEPEELATIDDTIVENRKNKFIQQVIENTGFLPEETITLDFENKQKEFLRSMGRDRFVKYFRNIFDEKIDVEVFVTDERFNKVIAVQQLRDMLVAFSRLPVGSRLNTDAILGEILNIMGIRGEFFLEKERVPSLSAQATQAGRIAKELPEVPQTEQEVISTAERLPQAGEVQPRGRALGVPEASALPIR